MKATHTIKSGRTDFVHHEVVLGLSAETVAFHRMPGLAAEAGYGADGAQALAERDLSNDFGNVLEDRLCLFVFAGRRVFRGDTRIARELPGTVHGDDHRDHRYAQRDDQQYRRERRVTRLPALKDRAMNAITAKTAPTTCNRPSPVTIPRTAPRERRITGHRRFRVPVASSASVAGSAMSPTPPPNPASVPRAGGRTRASPSLENVRAAQAALFAFFVQPEDQFPVAGTPRREAVRAQPGLVGADQPVRQRQHPEHEDQGPEPVPGADERVGEEEERHELELLAVSAGDLQDAPRLGLNASTATTPIQAITQPDSGGNPIFSLLESIRAPQPTHTAPMSTSRRIDAAVCEPVPSFAYPSSSPR